MLEVLGRGSYELDDVCSEIVSVGHSCGAWGDCALVWDAVEGSIFDAREFAAGWPLSFGVRHWVAWARMRLTEGDGEPPRFALLVDNHSGSPDEALYQVLGELERVGIAGARVADESESREVHEIARPALPSTHTVLVQGECLAAAPASGGALPWGRLPARFVAEPRKGGGAGTREEDGVESAEETAKANEEAQAAWAMEHPDWDAFEKSEYSLLRKPDWPCEAESGVSKQALGAAPARRPPRWARGWREWCAGRPAGASGRLVRAARSVGRLAGAPARATRPRCVP